MDVLTSSEFRKRYASITGPTTVTVNGHAIGVWTPATTDWATFQRTLDADITAKSPVGRAPLRRMTQAERDAVLRRVNTKS